MTRNLIAAALLAVCATAHAADPMPTNWYVGGDLGVTRYTAKTLDDRYTDVVLGLAVGYSPSPYLSIEAEARALGTFDGVFDPSYYPGAHYGANVVGSLPLSEHWVATARAGYGTTRMESEDVNSPAYHVSEADAGVGLRWDFAANWGVTLSATRYFKSERTLAMLGMQFRF